MAFTFDRSPSVTLTVLNDLWGLAKEVAVEALPDRVSRNSQAAQAIRDLTVTDGVDPGAAEITSDVDTLLRYFMNRLRSRSIGRPRLTADSAGFDIDVFEYSTLAGSTNLVSSPIIQGGPRRALKAWAANAIELTDDTRLSTVRWTTSGIFPYLRSIRKSFQDTRDDFAGWADVPGDNYAEDNFLLWLGSPPGSVPGGDSENFTPGANPARQDLAAGLSPVTTTFNAATGGNPAYTYSSALSRPAGSSATIAGSGLGPFTWSSTADGESYLLSLTATDISLNKATAVAIVDIAASVAAGSTNFSPGADVARQDLASGATPVNTTFNAATGGVLPYSYATILSRPGGSSAAVSGSNLGPYGWTGTADGESYVLSLTATDVNSNKATSIALVDIAAPAAGGATAMYLIPGAVPVTRVARTEFVKSVFSIVT